MPSGGSSVLTLDAETGSVGAGSRGGGESVDTRDDGVAIEQVFGYCSPRTTATRLESTGQVRGGDRCQWSGIPSLVSPGEGTSPKLTSHAHGGCEPPREPR